MTESFRVCLMTDYLGTLAGTEENLIATALELVRRSVDVRVAVYPRDCPVHSHWRDVLGRAGIVLWEVELGTEEAAFFTRLAGWLALWRPHIVHAIPMGLLALGWYETALAGMAPLIGTETSEASTRCTWYDPGDFPRLRNLRAIVVPCDSIADGVRNYFKYTGRIEEIPFVVPVPEDRQRPLCHADLARVRDFGAITRLRVEKGIEYMLAAIALLARAKIDVTLTIYGETPELERTREQSEMLGISRRVRIVGPFRGSDELERVIEPHCIFLLSSLFEGQPLAIVHAIARGRVCVATDVGGVSGLLAASGAGCVVPVADPRAMADAVASLLESPDRVLEMSHRSVAVYRATPGRYRDAAAHWPVPRPGELRSGMTAGRIELVR